jgi:hypothetical protein
MASILKVDKLDPQSGTALEIGSSGDTATIPSGATLTIASGATLTNSGTATGFAGIAWQSVVTASTLTAVAGRGYPINTTSNACTVTLPASASVGDQIVFTDYARNFATNALTLNPNSLKYQGNTSPNPEYDTNGESVHIVYMDATNGWIPLYDGAVALETPQYYTIDFLCIGGGGGAGSGENNPYNRAGGGGGAGGYRNSYGSEASGGGGSSETAITDINTGVVLTIDVGGGGAGGSGNSAVGTIGEESSIKGTGVSITSGGGGYGADNGVVGGPGGSGGGGGASQSGAYAGGAGTSNQGYAGQAGAGNAGGGGGGAGEVGGTDANGEGGDGLSSSITGAATDRGGGGGAYYGQQNDGGTGGGGNSGTNNSADATAGTANTGGGGGGSENEGADPSAEAGGSGVVILRMPTANYSTTTTGSPTVGTDGSDTILTFNGDGSYTT